MRLNVIWIITDMWRKERSIVFNIWKSDWRYPGRYSPAMYWTHPNGAPIHPKPALDKDITPFARTKTKNMSISRYFSLQLNSFAFIYAYSYLCMCFMILYFSIVCKVRHNHMETPKIMFRKLGWPNLLASNNCWNHIGKYGEIKLGSS